MINIDEADLDVSFNFTQDSNIFSVSRRNSHRFGCQHYQGRSYSFCPHGCGLSPLLSKQVYQVRSLRKVAAFPSRNKSEIRLGDWFVCQAVAIKPKGESEITGQKLLASHIVIKEIEPFAMKDQFPDWQQRQYGGIFEVGETLNMMRKSGRF